MEYTFEAFRQLGHPEKARILIHLEGHPGDSPEEISEHMERPVSTIYHYLADLEMAGLVRAEDVRGVRHFKTTPFRITVDVHSLNAMLQAPFDPVFALRQRIGMRAWTHVMEAVERARQGQITLRQAAKRSGLPYREFISVYQTIDSSLAPETKAPRRQLVVDRD